MLTLSRSTPVSRCQASTTGAKASLTSNRSISSRLKPARSSTLAVAGITPVSMYARARRHPYRRVFRYLTVCRFPVAASADEDLRRTFLQPRGRPAKRPQGLRVACGRDIEQLSVLGRLRALAEQRPVDRGLGGDEVEPAQVAQQQQAGLGPPTHQLGGLLTHGAQRPAGALGSGLVGIEVEVEPLARLGQRAHVPARPPGERLGQVEDIVVGLVALPYLEELLGQPALGAVDGAEGEVQLHRARSRRTAATFRSGCLEFGSQAVRVSSLAARWWPSPPASQ